MRTLGFSWPVLIGLALLAVPRVVLHDLGVIEEGTPVNALFVFVPAVCWVVAVLVWRPPRPFLTVLVIGVIYGVFLAATHQVLWDVALGGATPTLGGNLRDLDPGVQTVLLRAVAAVSSLLTGAVTGAVSGAVAAGLCRLVPARQRS
jgi:hypothetical protein